MYTCTYMYACMFFVLGCSSQVTCVQSLASRLLSPHYVAILSSTARVVVVKVSGHPILCKTDEIGEICVQSMAAGSAYWGLQGKTTHTFRVSCHCKLNTYSCTCTYMAICYRSSPVNQDLLLSSLVAYISEQRCCFMSCGW